jgi:hypothetical protein
MTEELESMLYLEKAKASKTTTLDVSSNILSTNLSKETRSTKTSKKVLKMPLQKSSKT